MKEPLWGPGSPNAPLESKNRSRKIENRSQSTSELSALYRDGLLNDIGIQIKQFRKSACLAADESVEQQKVDYPESDIFLFEISLDATRVAISPDGKKMAVVGLPTTNEK